MTVKRAGKTVKVSVSIDQDDLVVLRRHARATHDGNLSAAFADAAKWIRQREARVALVDLLGGPTMTPAIAAAVDAEQAGVKRDAPKKPRAKRAA